MGRSTRVGWAASPTVADTGAIFALLDRRDAWHERVVRWWHVQPRRVILPASILAELCYLLQRRLGASAEIDFLRAVERGEFRIEALESEDYPRIAELAAQFGSLPLGFVDASVLAVAERLGATEILTTDRRHFTVAKSANGAAVVP